jgi:transposase
MLLRAIKASGSKDINHSYPDELIKKVGRSEAMHYELTSYLSQSPYMAFLEYGYFRSEYDLPQVNAPLAESSESGIFIFYDIYPESIVDVLSSWTRACFPLTTWNT